MRILKGFPTRYKDIAPPSGDEWLATFNAALPLINNGGIALFYGAHGTGKTRMAYELAMRCQPKNGTCIAGGSIVRDRPAIYTTAVGMFMDFRDTYRKDSDISEKKLMASYADAALLVIDEIQDRGETIFEDTKLTAVIDARYMVDRPTILVSNFDRKRFAQTLSPAVLNRIQENGKGFEFNWNSYRNNQ
jgi:DNA replication protein DnaC